MRFLYILPYSARLALVEYTLSSANLLRLTEYEQALGNFLKEVLQTSSYRIKAVESGVIPMTDQPFKRRVGNHVLNIGNKGGLFKTSTGYSYLRIQHDTDAIVASLIKNGHPFENPKASRLHLFLDSIMLNIMFRRANIMKIIFTELFKNNSIQRLISYLDERVNTLELVQILLSIPPWPFLKTLFRMKILSKV